MNRKESENIQIKTYLEIITKLPTMAHAIDKNGILIGVSDFWLKKMGYERKDVIGKPSTSFLSEESKNYAEKTALPDYFARGFIENVPYQFVRKDKGTFDVLLSANSVYSEEGDFICSLATITDISDKKLVETALKESDTKFKKYFDMNPSATFVWKYEGNDFILIDVNRAAESLTENNASAFIGLKASKIYKNMPEMIDRFNECFNQKTTVEFEQRYLNRYKGEYHWCKFRLTFSPPNLLLLYVDSIHQLKETILALQESEAKLRGLFSCIKDGIVVVGTDRFIIDCNPGFCDLFGYSMEEIRGLGMRNLYASEDKYIELGHTLKQHVGDAPFTEIIECTKKNGDVFTAEVTVFFMKNSGGQVTSHIGLVRDITARIKAERSLRESEEKLKEAQALGKIGNWEYDIHSREITWSDEVFRLHERDPIEGPPDYDQNMPNYHPEDSQRLQKQVQTAIEKGITAEDDYRLKLPSGKSVWHHGKIFVKRGENGQTEKLMGTVQDITDRKVLEESLAIEKKRLSMLLESFPGFIYLQAPDYSIPFANKYFVKNFGNPAYQPCYKLFRQSDTPCDPCPTFEVFDTNQPHVWEWFGAPDGKTYMIHDYPFIDTDGSELVLVIGIDITDQKNTLFEKEKIQKQLFHAQKMESIGTLAGGIAHDFNNILSSIIGFTELALDEASKGSTLEDSLHEVHTAGKRAKALVKQILAFARQSEEKKSPIQPTRIAEEVLHFIRSTIPTTIEIQQNLESASWILGNKTQIQQVLMNLCTNAAQAMEDSGGVLSISTKDQALDGKVAPIGTRSRSYVEIMVSDTGVGISPEIIESIFEPYFTTKGHAEGTGLGLAMVHGIIESYGGTICVDSQLGKGTTFTISLPASKKKSSEKEFLAEQLPTGTERILFVDDEAPIAKVGGQILERLGYSVTTRTSSVEALELFKAKPNRFDLVVTDMTMPQMTGDKLAVEILKIRPDIPVILCTGYSKKISDETASKIGIKSFAYKPVVKMDLAKTVRSVLDEVKD